MKTFQRPSVWISVVCLLYSMAVANTALAAKVQILFDDWEGPPLKVFLSRPSGLAPDRPVVFLMHGASQNAETFRNQWHELAVEHDVLLVFPEFDQADFAGSSGYSFSNVLKENGEIKHRGSLPFSAIELIFDDIRTRFEMSTETYSLYGQSSGAQFVQRFLYFFPDASLAQLVLADADWYTMPDFETEFPWGLKNSTVNNAQLAAALQLPVTIMLGGQDIDPEYASLPGDPEVMVQGENTLERGVAFYQAARARASELSLPFTWSLSMVEKADRKNREMVSAAMEVLLRNVESADD